MNSDEFNCSAYRSNKIPFDGHSKDMGMKRNEST